MCGMKATYEKLKMIMAQRSKFMSLFSLYRDRALEIETRNLMTHSRLLSMVILILKRVLFVSSSCKEKKTMDEDSVSKETKRIGYEICRDSIGDVWADITEDEFQITPLSGGLTNYLYICSLPDNVQPPDNQPKSVLLRVYGHIAAEAKIVLQNSVIFALMSEKQLGPKLYGMTNLARVEELVPAKTLVTEDIQNPTLSRLIAQKLSLFHSLNMPLRKEPCFLNDTMDEWMIKVQTILKQKHKNPDEQLMQTFREYRLENELQVLKDILSRVQSPVVFSHNDLQEGNILYNETVEENKKMVVIDWEYCSYNYRGYDLGNHFLEWTYNYNYPRHPYFESKPENYPSREQQYDFFRAYLQASGENICDETLQAMYIEANTFALASHFFWALWSILQNSMSDIEFGFLEYAAVRFEGYFMMKKNLPIKD
ncbi:hypothetical protein ACF0H5_016244 [Mactra antiquata]